MQSLGSFLGNMGGSTNGVAQLKLPSNIVLESYKIDWRNLTRFNKIAIQKYKLADGKWTKKPLAYRESNN